MCILHSKNTQRKRKDRREEGRGLREVMKRESKRV
jgi:hypothetical protein